MSDADTKADELLASAGIAYSVQYIGETKRDKWECDEWRITFKAALKELESCGGTDNGFDLMKRLPDGTLTTEF